ncbi:MAG TPA: hypothetical protein VF711_01410 [Acidimicrobiales bacterium]|jgi:hypothetical protein
MHSRYRFLQGEFYRTRAIVGFGAGVVSAAIAGVTTWAYLSSITLDDGLEVFIFFPFLAVGVAVSSAILAWGAVRGAVTDVALAIGSGALLGSCVVTVVAGAPGAILAVVLFGAQWIVGGCLVGCGIAAAIRASAPGGGHLNCRGRRKT